MRGRGRARDRRRERERSKRESREKFSNESLSAGPAFNTQHQGRYLRFFALADVCFASVMLLSPLLPLPPFTLVAPVPAPPPPPPGITWDTVLMYSLPCGRKSERAKGGGGLRCAYASEFVSGIAGADLHRLLAHIAVKNRHKQL